MASVCKRKGTKTYLTTGKKSTKYRKISQGLNLQQSLNSEQILEQPISLEADEGDTNEINLDFTQAQPIELTHVTQTKPSPNRILLEKGTQADNIHNTSSVGCNTNILTKRHVSTHYNIADLSSNGNVDAIKAGNKLLHALQKDENFSTFALLLEEHEQTTKFVKLVTTLGTQKMKMSNMSWKTALDMGSLYMCTTTSKMTYDKEWLEFCQVMYHMFGSGVMNTLRGRAHFSHVTSSKSQKGYYKPVEGEFNFPIPSLPTLKNLDIGYPTDVPVGMIQHSLDLAAERAKNKVTNLF